MLDAVQEKLDRAGEERERDYRGRAEAARSRAGQANLRAAEIQERHQRLSGGGSTPSPAYPRQAVEAALRHAQEAARWAETAHIRAAAAHERAVSLTLADADGHGTGVGAHREAARNERREAEKARRRHSAHPKDVAGILPAPDARDVTR